MTYKYEIISVGVVMTLMTIICGSTISCASHPPVVLSETDIVENNAPWKQELYLSSVEWKNKGLELVFQNNTDSMSKLYYCEVAFWPRLYTEYVFRVNLTGNSTIWKTLPYYIQDYRERGEIEPVPRYAIVRLYTPDKSVEVGYVSVSTVLIVNDTLDSQGNRKLMVPDR